MNGKKLLALCCALLLLIGAAGCGNTVSGNETDTEAVHTALKKLEDCTSCTALQITEISESAVEDEITYSHSGTTEMEITLIAGPRVTMKTENRAQATYDGQETSQHTISYIIPENGGYSEYYFDGTEWFYVFVEDENAMPNVRVVDIATMFVMDSLSFRKAKTETLDGGKAVRYDSLLGGTDLVNFLSINGLLSSITSMSENQQNKIKENLAKDLDSLTVSVWVDDASGYPVRFEMDISGILVDLEKSIAKTLGNQPSDTQWTISKYSMTMILSDINAVEAIVIPPEAENATPYEEIAS